MGISREQALDCFASDDLIGIGMEADAVRRQLHPEGVVSYLVDEMIDVSTLDEPLLQRHIEAALDMGATGLRLRGFSNVHKLEDLESLLTNIRQHSGSLWLQGLTAGELLTLSRSAGISVHDTILRLRDAGMDSLAPAADCDDWLSIHRTAHTLGMKTSAAMVFGGTETLEQRVDQLEAIRNLQSETGGFTAFIPSTFEPSSAQRAQGLEETTAVEYLQTLAIARMFLDNIENVQASVETQGLKVVQMGLRFGGNDVGSALPGASGATEEELRRIIRDAGFRPAQRDTLYRTMFLN